MTRILASELQTLRGRVFFWIGLVILPVFWVWWMRPAYFSRRQRAAGWMWTGCYLVGLIVGRQFLSERLDALAFSYSSVAVQVGMVLWLWWALRVFSVGQIIVVWLVSVDVIAILASLWIPTMSRAGPLPGLVIFLLVPAVLHLMLEPYLRWRRELTVSTVETLRKWIRLVLICCLVVLGSALWVHHMWRQRGSRDASDKPQSEVGRSGTNTKPF